MADLSITAASVLEGAGASTVYGTLGATVTAGQAVVKNSSNVWVLADNNSGTAALRQAGGIALNGGATGQPVKVLTRGNITIGASVTAGTAYYLSDTPGGICPLADVGSGEYVCLLGIATTSAIINVNIQFPNVAL